MSHATTAAIMQTVGVDVGDRRTSYCHVSASDGDIRLQGGLTRRLTERRDQPGAQFSRRRRCGSRP